MIVNTPKPGKLYKITKYKESTIFPNIKNLIDPFIVGYPTQNLHNNTLKQIHTVPSDSIIMFLSTQRTQETDRYIIGKYRWSWKVLHNNKVIFIPKTIKIKFRNPTD